MDLILINFLNTLIIFINFECVFLLIIVFFDLHIYIRPIVGVFILLDKIGIILLNIFISIDIYLVRNNNIF
jgi:hypothetical protein